MGIRIKEHIEDCDLFLYNISDRSRYLIPPWELSKPLVDLTLTADKKSETNHTELKQKYLELKETYDENNFISVFTDGSKTEQNVSAAAIINFETIKTNLPKHASIFTAEATAILTAIEYIQSKALRKCVIFSDSLSCLKSIGNMQLSNNIILDIIEKTHYLTSVGTEIVFCWVPSHIGIIGNTKADKAAKLITDHDLSNSKIPYCDIKPTITKYVNNIFKTHWDTQMHNKLHSINPNINFKPSELSFERKDEVKLTRLRIGHTKLTHEFLLLGEDPPECIPCGCILTVKHILIDCIDFKPIRDTFYSETNLKTLFDNVAGDIILAFLNEIHFYDKL